MPNPKKIFLFRLFLVWAVVSISEPVFADFRAGYDAFLKKDYPGALSLLISAPLPKGSALSDYYLWALGRSRIEKGEFEAGRKDLEELLRVEPSSLLADPARVQIGRALRSQGQAARAVEWLTPLSARLSGDLQGEAWYELALAEADIGKKDAALKRLTQVYFEFSAAAISSQVPAQWQKMTGTSLPEGTSAERMLRADRLFEGKNYTRAAELYAGLQGDLARVRRGESLYALKRYTEAIPLLTPSAAVDAASARLALLHLGMSQLRSGNETGAVNTFEDLQRRYPGTDEGEEALYRAGMIAYQAGRISEASAVFQRLVDAYPHGGFRDKAVWAAAWSAYRQSDFSGSMKWLQAMEQGATDGATRGKALYWKARIAEKQGQAEAAKPAYQLAAKAAPFSYYGFMALKKMRGASEPLPETPPIPAEWKPALAPPILSGSETGIEEALRHFKKAEALAAAGLGRLAQPELDAALAATGDSAAKRHLLESASKTQAYFIPTLFGQKYWDQFKSLFSTPEAAENYRPRLLYPYAYRREVEQAAARSQVPAALVVGLMRQESGFMPWITSSANAQGLMQLLPATAAGRAKALGIPAGDLFDPDYNIMVGSSELKAMLDRFSDNWILAMAAYNAGPGRAKQWLEQFGSSLGTDEFIEEIPFSETNLYVKLVLRNYWTYRSLYP